MIQRTIQDYMTESDKMFYASFMNQPPKVPKFKILDQAWKRWKYIIIEELSGDTYMYEQKGLSVFYKKWIGSKYELIAKFTVRV